MPRNNAALLDLQRRRSKRSPSGWSKKVTKLIYKCGSAEEALEVVKSGKCIIFTVRPTNVTLSGAVAVT